MLDAMAAIADALGRMFDPGPIPRRRSPKWCGSGALRCAVPAVDARKTPSALLNAD